MSTREPENIILYGAPGTGKTYETKELAVRLCGEPVSRNRVKLTDTYKKLIADGRIEFVTFHQSVSYEDFVEGLQPVIASSEADESSSIGFHLKVESGVFRRLADRATRNLMLSLNAGSISISKRQISRLSFDGRSDLDHNDIFDKSIKDECIFLNIYDQEFGDKRYRELPDIRSYVGRVFGDSLDSIDINNRIVELDYFRNCAEIGDIVVVPKDETKFQAIGVIIGEYKFVSDAPDHLYHQREVKWCWVDKRGKPVDGIFNREFSPVHSFHSLSDSIVDANEIERLINSHRFPIKEKEKNFVIIIDEINRANISKVFGELISLIEIDKRVGKSNEIFATLPYSGDRFGVPKNLHIIGTMNSADRSTALIDTALRRRFSFRELLPKPNLLSTVDGIDLKKVLTIINERIEYLYDREHRIGHAYFMKCSSKKEIDDVMRYRIIPLLSDYFLDDWSKVAAVLGDLECAESGRDGGFLEYSDLDDLRTIGDDSYGSRRRWSIIPDWREFKYENLISKGIS